MKATTRNGEKSMKILFIFGTRPEAIKLAPLINEFEKCTAFDVKTCVTAQHRQLLEQVTRFFSIKTDYDLDLMSPNQSLFDITAEGLRRLEQVIKDCKPDVVFVQGDTTTTFIGAIAGFYEKAKIVHIEAGLRSYDKYSPFPEEINRILVGHLADYHFTPTKRAKQNLLREGIKEDSIYVVGNTAIDALLLTMEMIKDKEDELHGYFDSIDFGKRIILVTGHRRESFGEPFRDICYALNEIASNNDVEIVYPVHLNPNVRTPVFDILSGVKNIHLLEPLDYPYMIWLMSKSYMVLTDSGGVQEEAPSLGKPVLVMRDVTERMEGITAGTAKLVGVNKDVIVTETMNLLHNPGEYGRMAKAVNPYGDGKTSERIVEIIKQINVE